MEAWSVCFQMGLRTNVCILKNHLKECVSSGHKTPDRFLVKTALILNLLFDDIHESVY